MNECHYKNLLVAEGFGGTAEAGDPGGLTVFGITKRYEPDWQGWARFHNLRFSPSWQSDPELLGLVRQYYQGVWDWLGLDGIKNEKLRGCIFGGYVNQGPKVIRWLQEAEGSLRPDKIMGPVTLGAIAKAEECGLGEVLYLRLAMRRVEYYAETANPVILRGLLFRVLKGGA